MNTYPADQQEIEYLHTALLEARREHAELRAELAEAREELARLNKMRTHCERCGGDYMATGLDAECPCLIKQSRDVWKASCDEADCDVLRLKEELARLKAQPQPLPRPDEAGWLPGPANGGGGTAGPCTEKYPSGQWWDGDELLVAVDVRSNVTGEEWKEYHAVRILCDEESFHVERMDDGDDIGWGPESWSWYMPIPSLPATPPPVPEKGVEG